MILQTANAGYRRERKSELPHFGFQENVRGCYVLYKLLSWDEMFDVDNALTWSIVSIPANGVF